MIRAPTSDEIQRDFNEAHMLYPYLPELTPRLLLIPHAGIHESRVVTAATLSYIINKPSEIILLGTNHKLVKLSSPLSFITDTTEHSLTINRAFLSYMGLSCRMALLDPSANTSDVASNLVQWLDEDPNHILIASSDLSHYHTNQEQDNMNEAPLIQGLIYGDPNLTAASLTKVNACGSLVLKVIAKIANMLDLRGKVACYNDSRDKRFGWSTVDGKAEVSYVGILWLTHGVIHETLSMFDEQQLVAFAKSCIIAELTSAQVPELPSWSPWYRVSNGAFVGIKDTMGHTRASIGRYQSSEKTCVYNVRTSALATVEDAQGRWKQPLQINEKYIFYINILQDKSQWKAYNPTQLIDKISPSDNYGFYLTIGNLEATFLPSVWADINTSFSDLMTALTQKAGGEGSEWKNLNARLQLYHTLYIELHIP